MKVQGLNHVTLRCRPRDLPALHRFYTEVIGFAPGWRPAFSFDGYWMYPPEGQVAAIHIAATRPDDSVLDPAPATGMDHISLTTTGLASSKRRLAELAVPFDEVPVPGSNIMQLFLRDPLGVKLELTFVGEHT